MADEDKIITYTEKTIAHPLEDVFGIPPNTTIVDQQIVEHQPSPVTVVYDDKDVEIDEKLDKIYNTAMDNAEALADEIEVVEGKYKARMGEISATMLTVALGAVREKAQFKTNKDRLKPNTNNPRAVGDNNNISNTNNIIVADRNELLRAFMNKSQTFDGEKQ